MWNREVTKARNAPADPLVGQSISSEESVKMTSPGTSNLARASRNPFLSWELDRAWAPDCLDAQRIQTLAEEARESLWNDKRRHAPCSEKAPRGVSLDCIYLREEHEHEYVQNLVAGTAEADLPDTTEVASSLLFLSKPLVPMHWSPAPQRYHGDPIQEYPQRGDIALTRDTVPRDSGYALYAAAVSGSLNPPGRLLKEYRREWRHRRKGLLKGWSQTEFYHVPQHARETMYPKTPEGWNEIDMPARMYVPLPPVVTYRGSQLIRKDPTHWTIFRTEWTALVFGRWVADIHFRGLLWRLPPKVRVWVSQLGMAALLQGSPVTAAEAQALLTDHENVDWTRYEVVVSDTLPEDGIVKMYVAPVLYKKGKVTLENLVRSAVPRFAGLSISSRTASESPYRPAAMADNRPANVPALRSALPPTDDPYAPRPAAAAAQAEPQGAPVGYDPYAPVQPAAPQTSALTAGDPWVVDPYLPAPRVASQAGPYAATAYTPGGGGRAMVGTPGGGERVDGDGEFARLYDLLAESGHARMLARFANSQGRVNADAVVSYVHWLDTECRRLGERVRGLQESHDRLHEQLYEERRSQVAWLSGALHSASERLNEPVRKRRRDYD
jgi:hypothetical protein